MSQPPPPSQPANEQPPPHQSIPNQGSSYSNTTETIQRVLDALTSQQK